MPVIHSAVNKLCAMSKGTGDIVNCLISHLRAFICDLCNTLVLYVLPTFVWGAVEWSQEVLRKLQCLALFQLCYSSGWSLCRIVYIENCFASCVSNLMTLLGNSCNRSVSLLSFGTPKRERESSCKVPVG